MMIDKLQSDLKEAQIAKDEIRISTLRLLLSEIHNLSIQKGGDLTGDDLISVIQKEVKRRKEAAAGFRSGQREELAKKEEAELKILQGYLPDQISDEELTKLIEDTIKKIGATSISDMGKVIGSVMSQLKGQADGGRVSSLVKEKLS